MLMLERDGTLIEAEQTAARHHESSLQAAIDAYIAGQVDRHMRDVATLLDDLHQQIAPIGRLGEAAARRG
jgi:hypothetical protein